MQIIQPLPEMTRWSEEMIASGKTIALVPTMGYFHDGHLSLMRLAARRADSVVVSLFVNALQFGPNEDLGRYPMDMQRDSDLAASEKVDVLFVPAAGEMYPPDFHTQVKVDRLTATLCGRQRPTHFAGVTTVVAKLFNIIKPHFAVFGQKDFQQLTVIRRMVRDLNWNIEILSHPIVREPDGLAMSSRNTYLSREERSKALSLFRAIQHAKGRFAENVTDATLLKSEINAIITSEPGVAVEYISFVDRDTLADREEIDSQTVLALAVKVGATRLIDNSFMGEIPLQATEDGELRCRGRC